MNGLHLEGPTLDKARLSFVGYFPSPIRHGMTMGELARLFNAENKIGADLTVVPVKGWKRDQWFDQTAYTIPAPGQFGNAKKGTITGRRLLLRQVGADAATKMFKDIAPKFADRAGGYTRVIKLGRRQSDGSPVAIVEFVS